MMRMQDYIPLEDAEKEFAYEIFLIEKNLGVYIDGEYPLAKLHSQADCLQRYVEEQEAHRKGRSFSDKPVNTFR